MGYKIKEKRKERNMTQDQLSKKSAISRSTIASLESGKATVTSTATIKKIASALGCSVSDIFCD